MSRRFRMSRRCGLQKGLETHAAEVDPISDRASRVDLLALRWIAGSSQAMMQGMEALGTAMCASAAKDRNRSGQKGVLGIDCTLW
jgi:hypothetical protein